VLRHVSRAAPPQHLVCAETFELRTLAWLGGASGTPVHRHLLRLDTDDLGLGPEGVEKH
jgi:hypothetical protein